MVKVKICGIKTLQDVEIINRQKPDFTGFVFYPLSKRYVSLITARSLTVCKFNNGTQPESKAE